jgi:hypothetical protein
MSSIRPLGACPKQKPVVDDRSKGCSEDSIQVACEDILNFMRIRYIHIPKVVYNLCSGYINWGGKRVVVPQWVRATIARYLTGIPDLLILSKDGRFYAVELKTEKGKQRQGQVKFEKQVGSDNYYLIRSVAGFQELIKGKNIT